MLVRAAVDNHVMLTDLAIINVTGLGGTQFLWQQC
jgi:hypothetical protein